MGPPPSFFAFPSMSLVFFFLLEASESPSEGHRSLQSPIFLWPARLTVPS